MEIKQLESFVETAHIGNITRAAGALYLSQPALSRTIHRLEAELGFPLFARRATGIELTAAGAAFLPCAEQAVAQIHSGLNLARDAAGARRAELNVACAFEGIDQQLLYTYHQSHPNIRASIILLPPEEARTQLLNRTAGFALIPENQRCEELEWVPLMEEELLLSPSPGHPFAGRRSVSIGELNGSAIICNEVAFDHRSIEQICSRHNISLDLMFQSNDHQQVGAFQSMMNGMVFVPASAVLHSRKDEPDMGGRSAPVHPFLPTRIIPHVFQRSIGIAYLRENVFSGFEADFYDLICRYYAELQTQVNEFLSVEFPRLQEEQMKSK